MIRAFLILVGCDYAGDCLRTILHLPVPGAVIGMLLLAAGLALRDRKADADDGASSLGRTADALLANMGLLFVPAGVGIIGQAGLLRQEWLPVAVAVIGSTLIGLTVTGLVMHGLSRSPRESVPSAAAPRGTAS